MKKIKVLKKKSRVRPSKFEDSIEKQRGTKRTPSAKKALVQARDEFREKSAISRGKMGGSVARDNNHNIYKSSIYNHSKHLTTL